MFGSVAALHDCSRRGQHRSKDPTQQGGEDMPIELLFGEKEAAFSAPAFVANEISE